MMAPETADIIHSISILALSVGIYRLSRQVKDLWIRQLNQNHRIDALSSDCKGHTPGSSNRSDKVNESS